MLVNKIGLHGSLQRILGNVLKAYKSSAASDSAAVQYLKRRGNSLAYRSTPAVRQDDTPGIIFCPGFQSNMQGVKATSLESYCISKGLAYVRLAVKVN